jgi:hypothetical protein
MARDHWVEYLSCRAIIGWRVGKRNADTTLEFLHDLRGRVIGQPEISTDGFLPYRNSIRDAFATAPRMALS